MKKLMVMSVVAAVAACANAVTQWTGNAGVVDWASGNWSNGAPSVDNPAEFTMNPAVYKVTPPGDYAGRIIVSAETASGSYKVPATVEFTVAEGAAWTIAGDGVVLATEGVDKRVGEDFTGSV